MEVIFIDRKTPAPQPALEIEDRKKENRKRVTVFVALSVVAHFYLLLFSSVLLDKNVYDLIFNSPKDNSITIENIFVDTHTLSKEIPKKGLASQNPNIDSSPKIGEKAYHYINESDGGPMTKPSQNNQQAAVPEAAKTPAADKSPDGWQKPSQDSAVTAEKSFVVPQVVNTQPYSDYHTSYSDKKKADVTMDTRGDISISTLPVENAAYLSNIRKKVVESWKVFFPVFQYYQGLLKPGDVVIQFVIDQDGVIHEAKVLKSFGYNIADEAALNAVLYAGNFGPLPEGLKEKGVLVIHFNFAY
jgi:TonB family protein